MLYRDELKYLIKDLMRCLRFKGRLVPIRLTRIQIYSNDTRRIDASNVAFTDILNFPKKEQLKVSPSSLIIWKE